AGGRTSATARTTARSRLEFHLGRSGRVGRRLEERPGLKAGEPGNERAREEAEAGVVVARGLIELPALYGDPVLGSLELALQGQEVLVRLEVGVALDGDQQARQRARELALRLLALLQRLRSRERFGRELDRRGAGPRLRDLFQHRALLGRESLDGLDQVRHQVGAALVDVLYLRPLLVAALIESHERVVDGDRPHGDTADDDRTTRAIRSPRDMSGMIIYLPAP